MIDGCVRKIGMDGQLIDEAPIGPPPEPLHPEMSMREQALQEQEERAVEIARHAADSMARERERERRNDERHNAELQRRQEAISR
jgi:hypothetical protein